MLACTSIQFTQGGVQLVRVLGFGLWADGAANFQRLLDVFDGELKGWLAQIAKVVGVLHLPPSLKNLRPEGFEPT